jgi:hypothetical protein
MTPDISHYPALKLMGKDVHEVPEVSRTSCRGCSFDIYNKEDDDYECAVNMEKSQGMLTCGEKAIVYVRPTKKHIMAYITAKLSE